MSTSRADAGSYAGRMSDSVLPSEEASSAQGRPAVQATSAALASILGRVEATETLLSDVERAMERLEAGTYSLCEVCSAEIEPPRLEGSPVTRRCQSHAN